MPAGHAEHSAIDGVHKARGSEKRVAAIAHGRRARVVRESLDRHIPLPNADDALDHTDVQVFLVERTALLNVEFDVRVDVATPLPRARQVCRITAEKSDALANGLAAPADDRELVGGEVRRHRMAPPQATLFILEHHDVQRMARLHAGVRERLRHLDGPHGTDIAVVVPAVGHRVDVRPEQDWRERGVRAGAPADDIRGRVKRDVESGVAHELHDVRPRGLVRVGIGKAGHSALRIPAELGERGEVAVEPAAIHERGSEA